MPSISISWRSGTSWALLPSITTWIITGGFSVLFLLMPYLSTPTKKPLIAQGPFCSKSNIYLSMNEGTKKAPGKIQRL
jgi:hypothetical protein